MNGRYEWINELIKIGIPYAWGGRDASGLDCYGLLVFVYQRRYGIDLPDWSCDERQLRDRLDAIERGIDAGKWVESATPADGDIVICRGHQAAFHMGLYYGHSILHATESAGVVYEPLDRFKRRYQNIEIGTWES